MAEPEADRCNVDEAQEAFGGLVVVGGDAAGVLELVEAALNQVAQPVSRTNSSSLPSLAGWSPLQMQS